MSLFTTFRSHLNTLLAPANIQVSTLTAERAEMNRLNALIAAGHFEKPVFPLLKQFKDSDPKAIFDEVAKHDERFAEFAKAPKGGQQFSLDNDYFSSPDAEVLYAMVGLHQPQCILEVGSGNSTLLFRQAILDFKLSTRLISIDPRPRREIAQHSDEVIAERVEDTNQLERLAALKANDILFIDSSHDIKAGNDVLFLLLHVLPVLQPGVLIHIHDVFLPYEYPRAWIVDWKWGWTEQYLVQALLQDSAHYDVLWAGHYLQRTLPDFSQHFAHWRDSSAKSLWVCKL